MASDDPQMTREDAANDWGLSYLREDVQELRREIRELTRETHGDLLDLRREMNQIQPPDGDHDRPGGGHHRGGQAVRTTCIHDLLQVIQPFPNSRLKVGAPSPGTPRTWQGVDPGVSVCVPRTQRSCSPR